MNKKGVPYLFIILMVLSLTNSLAQSNSKEKIALSQALSVLETRLNINFTYLDQTIADKSIVLPANNLSLEETIAYLKFKTNLDFILLDKINIVISKRVTPFSNVITQELKEVTITNFLTKGISKSSDGKININTEEFGILPGLLEPDVLQSIQALPGVMSVDERISNINVHGGTHDQNLILWDGIKMYQSGHFFGLVSAFNPYLTKEVHISKNGTSVKFGDGVSSVINMQLSNTIDNDFKAGTGFNLINADGFVKAPIDDKAEIQISVRRSITDFVFTPTYNQYLQRVFQDSDFSKTQSGNTEIISNNERFYFYDIISKFLYDITDEDQLRFNFLVINNKLTYDQQSNDDSGNPLQNQLEQNNFATGFEYLKYWNKKFTTTAQFYYTNYALKATNFNIANDQRINQDNQVNDLGLKINATNYIDDHLKIYGGYQFSEVIISNAQDTNNPYTEQFIKEVVRTHSIYGEAEFTSANKNTYARIGLRTNYIEKFKEFFTEPRLSLSHKLSNDFRLELLGEFKSQTTSQVIDLQNDFLGIEKRRWILSNNENIPIIKSAQAGTGIHYNKNNLLISMDIFIKTVEGITSQSQGFQNQFQFLEDIGKFQAKGIDFLINKQFDYFSTWLSYSYSKNEYTFKNLNDGISFPNNIDISHAITFASTYDFESLKVALGFNWHSGRPQTLPLELQDDTISQINYGAPNTARIGDYFRTDISATYQLKFGRKLDASIGASIWNLFNKKNSVNTYYTKNSDGDILTVDNLSLGITPNISFRLRFQ